jgi:hypothetical protein
MSGKHQRHNSTNARFAGTNGDSRAHEMLGKLVSRFVSLASGLNMSLSMNLHNAGVSREQKLRAAMLTIVERIRFVDLFEAGRNA